MTSPVWVVFPSYILVAVFVITYGIVKKIKLNDWWYIGALLSAVIMLIFYIVQGSLVSFLYVWHLFYFTFQWFINKSTLKRLYIKLRRIKIKLGE